MKVFKNDNNQIRSGWKILGVYLSFYTATLVASILFIAIYAGIVFTQNSALFSEGDNGEKYITEQVSSMTTFAGAGLNLIQCLIMILFVVVFWRILEKRKMRDLGLTSIKNSWKDLFIGLLGGAVSFSIVAIILLCTKSVEFVNSLSQPRFSGSLIIELIVFIFVGINEELFARGYCMTVLKQTKNLYIPVIVSAIIFSLMHSLNSGISLLAYINLFLFGITMGYVFLKTKNIWMGIGYHITWNYFQGDVFGFLVSGIPTDSIYTIRTVNPSIINGGSFGPEGGIVVTILLLITMFVIYKFLPNREHIL